MATWRRSDLSLNRVRYRTIEGPQCTLRAATLADRLRSMTLEALTCQNAGAIPGVPMPSYRPQALATPAESPP